MIHRVFCYIDKIFTLNCRSILLALEDSPLVLAASTAFLYIPRRFSSSATISPLDADSTGFVSTCSSSCSSSISPAISCNSAYMIYL